MEAGEELIRWGARHGLLQLGVLGLGLLNFGKVGVGVFPEVKEALVFFPGCLSIAGLGEQPGQFQHITRLQHGGPLLAGIRDEEIAVDLNGSG